MGTFFYPRFWVVKRSSVRGGWFAERLAAEGLLDAAYPAFEAVAPPGSGLTFKPAVTENNEPLHRVLYSGAMMDFLARFLGGPVFSPAECLNLSRAKDLANPRQCRLRDPSLRSG